MPAIKKFPGEYIRTVLKDLGNTLKKKVQIYLIGGCSMIFRDLKETTKDVDIVLVSSDDIKEIVDTLKSMGFVEIRELPEEYQKLGASAILRNRDGFQIDIFYRQVCNGLEVTENMQKRAEFFNKFNNLEVYLIALEDIFLFKSITERELDLDDMRILAFQGLDWQTVKNECSSQPKRKIWESFLASRLAELKEKYDIDVPIYKEMFNIAEDALIANIFKEIITRGNHTVEKIAPIIEEKLKYKEPWTRKMLNRLVEEGIIKTSTHGRRKLYCVGSQNITKDN